jgi:hypothetical protein
MSICKNSFCFFDRTNNAPVFRTQTVLFYPESKFQDIQIVLMSMDALDFEAEVNDYTMDLAYLKVRSALCVHLVCRVVVDTVVESLNGSKCVYEAARFLVVGRNAEKVFIY